MPGAMLERVSVALSTTIVMVSSSSSGALGSDVIAASSRAGTDGLALDVGLGVLGGLAEVDGRFVGVRCRRCGCFVEPESLVEATQRCGRPPVAFAEELHRGGHEERADDGGVDEDGDGEPDAELLDGEDFPGGEAGEDDDDEERGGGDDAAAALQSDGDGKVTVAGLVVHFLDA